MHRAEAGADANTLSETVAEYNRIREGQDYVTMPYLASDELIERVCKDVVVEPHHHTHH